jgi:predicted DNA-binding transcriptional regulator YafY
MSAERLERLLNLTALLLDARRPVPAEEIREAIGGYPQSTTAFRRAFERDKDDLRSMGIPLVLEPVPGRLPELVGYRIPRDQYYLRDPGLSAEELAGLHLAASAVRVEGAEARGALLKLGGLLTQKGGAGDVGIEASLPSDPHLPVLFEAVVTRRAVRFVYNDEERTVEGYRIEHRRGRWYLSGHDHLRGEVRVFRTDRIQGPVTLTDDAPFDPPATGAPPGAARAPWELGEGEPVTARVRIDAEQATWALHHVGPGAVVAEHPDGSVDVELPVTNREALRSFVLSFLERAEVLAPSELREEIVSWLEALAKGPGR